VRDFLPAFELLDKNQHEALRCPNQRSLLVFGPPGSGKTVVAIYRAKQLRKSAANVDFIVRSRVLLSYVESSLKKSKIEADYSTFESWFKKYLKETLPTGTPVPRPVGKNFGFDWQVVQELFVRHNVSLNGEYEHLLVDEAQDIPFDFFRIAVRVSKHLTVFADENQSIKQGVNASLANLRAATAKFQPVEIKLNTNHRNTKEISRFASLFAVHGIETGCTESPERNGPIPILMSANALDSQAAWVARLIKNNSGKSIGILTRYVRGSNGVTRWVSLLKKHGVTAQAYDSNNFKDVPNFEKAGPFVICYESQTGLEFDFAIVPDIHLLPTEYMPDDQMRLYVAFSRARERLFVTYCAETLPTILADRIKGHETLVKFERLD
jgi:superfamily I DNA/RNA helicase